ncbi:chitin-binding protein [Streptomyces sp. CC53]|uniref:lytic polysaccharide monooxygenase auxiliary activity family 9 protein n=1 Tax=unclassified Streptomyces TaxID=2593676 RepID=UPI0008DD2158|nr:MULTISPECIES: lytic polysaccharide monooxygenase [unclassified Streptomyces]OII65282.1 chitin-binding protein [Streptomyces sp. CC53]
MSELRNGAAALAFAAVPLMLVATATPAAAHGSMTDPVSRVAACHAEGPENPKSDACKAAVAASGTQAFYDWNEVNIGDAAGRHRQLIPDGKLCSAGRDKYKGLDLPRADWPASPLKAGSHTFRYKATAPHRGSFALYLTKAGYDPSKPLTWADLEDKPFATATDPKLENGAYVIEGTVPQRSGRHLLYSVWQRSDSPEAFYTCSDVVFGGTAEPGPVASAPTDEQIEENADKSTVSHGGHGGDEHGEHDGQAGQSGQGEESGKPAPEGGNAPEPKSAGTAASPVADTAQAAPEAAAPGGPAPAEQNLAETGGSDATAYVAVGGAVVLAAGAALVFGAARRRTSA